MSVLLGCHNTRNIIDIREMKCPICGESIEIFVRDRCIIRESICEKCGYVVLEDILLENRWKQNGK